MYQNTIRLCGRLWIEITFFFLVAMGAQILPFLSPSPPLILILYSILMLLYARIAYRTHVIILCDDRASVPEAGVNLFGFILRIILVGFLAGILPGLIGLWIFTSVNPITIIADPIAFGLVYSGVATLVLYVFCIPFVGTLLPAYISGNRKGLGYAFERGMQNFGVISRRMFLGPFAIVFGLSVLAYFSANKMMASIQTLELAEMFDASFIALTIVSPLFQAFVAVMVAWVLSQSFLDIEDREKSASGADRNSTDLSQLPEGHIDTASDTSQV